MSKNKKKIRAQFREQVFSRDNNICKICKYTPKDLSELDAHHITDRDLMPNGGYVIENGITLCPKCHIKAEEFHNTGQSLLGYSPEDLYKFINSSYELAYSMSKK